MFTVLNDYEWDYWIHECIKARRRNVFCHVSAQQHLLTTRLFYKVTLYE